MTEIFEEDARRERIRAVIRDVVGDCPDSDDVNLRNHGVDSFTLIELVTALETAFSISVPDEYLQWCRMESVARISETITRGLLAAEAGKP